MIDTITENGHILDTLTNPAGTLRIQVSRNGAELISLAKIDPAGKWQGFLWRDGDTTKSSIGWNNHSTVMGYYVHRILNEKTQYRGQFISGGTHSFLRHKTFAEPEVGDAFLTYRLSGQEIVPGEYPYNVDFAITYRLSDTNLSVALHFKNHEACETHVSFGLHPGFGVTNLTDMQVNLPMGRYKRHFAPGNFLDGTSEVIDFSGGPMPFAVRELPGSFLLELEEVPERIFVLEDPATGRKTTLDFSESPYLTLWSDGGPFICIEPCWGLPDHHEQRAFENKLGIQIIPPGGVLDRSFTITPELNG